jgi:tryptophan 2,3-dioxygenase
MNDSANAPWLEASVHRDLSAQLDYARYLRLDLLLSAQHPRASPPQHDEMLFIVQHQVGELWFKLVLHELKAARESIKADDLDPCEKILARVKAIFWRLFEQWSVLETLTPSEYVRFRSVLGPASGLQSFQYRAIEFVLGNKHAEALELFAHHAEASQELSQVLNSPSLYDEFLRFLARSGHKVPQECIERDWSKPHERQAELVPVFQAIYENPTANWAAYALCEKLVDIDEVFQLWRFRHMKTVERIIGHKPGTGGSSGVSFLKQMVDRAFFPELIDVRTRIGRSP